MAVGAVLDKHKMAKHFEMTIACARFAFARKTGQIAQEAALDGLYAVRASLPEETLADKAAVKAYKSLSQVERAFRFLKTVDLHVRPIHHWLEDRVRAHVFLCMLAYYVEQHMRARRAPMLHDDDDKPADGAPVHAFQTVLADLATLARNIVVTANAPDRPFTLLTRPTPIQQKAFDLLGLPIACTQ